MPPPVFIGRDAEVALLQRAVEEVAAGRGRAILIEGEAGIGKSALLRTGLAKADSLGCQVALGSADEIGRRIPLRAFSEALGAGCIDVPNGRSLWLDVKSATGRRRVADPVVAANENLMAHIERMCERSPVVVVLDDMQWLDAASLLAWQRLARVTTQLPLLLLGSCRLAAGN